MREAVQRLQRRYGASFGHLVLLLATFAVAGYAALKLVRDRPVAVVIWFVGAAVAHDFVVLPLYTALDRVLRRRPRPDVPAPAWLNYVRFPAAISVLLLLVFLPSIARLSDRYTKTTGLSASGYVWHWVFVTVTLFALSGAAYALRTLRRSR